MLFILGLIKQYICCEIPSLLRPNREFKKISMITRTMVDCDQRTSTALKNNYYFLIHLYKGETLIIERTVLCSLS